jgi:hypothetical protein
MRPAAALRCAVVRLKLCQQVRNLGTECDTLTRSASIGMVEAVEMARDTRKTVRLLLTDEEWRMLREGAAQEGRSLSNYLGRLVRMQLAPPKRTKKKPPSQ